MFVEAAGDGDHEAPQGACGREAPGHKTQGQGCQCALCLLSTAVVSSSGGLGYSGGGGLCMTGGGYGFGSSGFSSSGGSFSSTSGRGMSGTSSSMRIISKTSSSKSYRS